MSPCLLMPPLPTTLGGGLLPPVTLQSLPPPSSAAAVCSAWEDLAPFLGRSRSEDKLIILVTLIIQHLLSYCYTQGTGHSAGATGEIKRLTCG